MKSSRRPIPPWRPKRQSPWRWSPRRHDMKAFDGLGPFVIVLRVRIN